MVLGTTLMCSGLTIIGGNMEWEYYYELTPKKKYKIVRWSLVGVKKGPSLRKRTKVEK